MSVYLSFFFKGIPFLALALKQFFSLTRKFHPNAFRGGLVREILFYSIVRMKVHLRTSGGKSYL